MTVSHWRRSVPPARIDCDVVVVGGGITGVSAALAFERRGLDVHVVERHTLAAGASSRNAGFLMRGCADHYSEACRLHGRDQAKWLWRLTEDNLTSLRALGVDKLPSYRNVPSYLLAMEISQEADLLRSCVQMEADGFEAPWVNSGTDRLWATGRIRGALVNPHDASVNPWELMTLLASRLRRPIHENAEVFAIDELEGPSGVRVRTADADLIAPHVLVCTNAYAPLLMPEFERYVMPRRGQMIALRFADSPVRLDASYYFNYGSEYVRQTPDGTIVFGGCRTYHADREVGYEDRVTPWVQADIERWATDLLGAGYEVTARWAGIMGFSRDGLPIVAPSPGFPSGRVWFCGGFTGHGMSMGHKTAELAVEAMLDGAEHPFGLDRFKRSRPRAAFASR